MDWILREIFTEYNLVKLIGKYNLPSIEIVEVNRSMIVCGFGMLMETNIINWDKIIKREKFQMMSRISRDLILDHRIYW
jgi:hypothetical protein